MLQQSLLEPLVRKLAVHSTLSEAERQAILELPFERQPVRTRSQIFRGMKPAHHCAVLLDGYAARTKLVRDGSRQILNVLIRGDMVGIQRCLFQRADHEVEMLTAGTVALIMTADLERLLARHPRLLRVLWSETLFDAAIQREWIVNVGRRDAAARLAHLLCELGLRHEQQGLSERGRFGLFMTQSQVADCAGLTAVHVNRVLGALSEEGLLSRQQGKVTIQDWTRLTQRAGFDSRYLEVATVR